MTQDEKRELLTQFATWMGEKVDERGSNGIDSGEWTDAGVRERVVDEFLSEGAGALGYSDDELKGTARDGG